MVMPAGMFAPSVVTYLIVLSPTYSCVIPEAPRCATALNITSRIDVVKTHNYDSIGYS